jgi:hypothetical protein
VVLAWWAIALICVGVTAVFFAAVAFIMFS